MSVQPNRFARVLVATVAVAAATFGLTASATASPAAGATAGAPAARSAGAVTNVPEPAGLTVLAVGGYLLMCRRKR